MPVFDRIKNYRQQYFLHPFPPAIKCAFPWQYAAEDQHRALCNISDSLCSKSLRIGSESLKYLIFFFLHYKKYRYKLARALLKQGAMGLILFISLSSAWKTWGRGIIIDWLSMLSDWILLVPTKIVCIVD